MNILLIMPRYIVNDGEWYTFPLGLPYISANLKQNGKNVYTLNLNHISGTVEKAISDMINKYDIKIVGVSVTHILYSHCLNILKIVKKIKNNVVTIIGGGLVSGDPLATMEAFPLADVGIIGEGEYSFLELVNVLERGADISTVPGIIYKKNGVLKKTPNRAEIKDISKLPWADYDGFLFEQTLDAKARDGHVSNNILPILSSRSCPFHCTFCFHTCGDLYRLRDLDDFFAELTVLVRKYPISLIVVYDELLTYNKKRLYEFCERIRKYNINWACSLRADMIDREILSTMKAANCVNASFGVEHVHPQILKSMDKRISLEQIERGLELLYEMGFYVDANILFGDVAETLETARVATSWLIKNPKYGLNVSHILTLPGSKDYEYAIENKLIDNPTTYLEKGEFDINLTSVDDTEYSEIIHEIDQLEITYSYWPEVYEIIQLDGNPKFGYAQIQCSRCASVFVSPSFAIDGRVRISCPYCHQSYIMQPYDYFLEHVFINIQKIIKEYSTVILLGRTKIAYQLLSYIKLNMPSVIVYISDYHHRTNHISFFGCQTISLEKITEINYDLIISCLYKTETLDIVDNYSLENIICADELL